MGINEISSIFVANEWLRIAKVLRARVVPPDYRKTRIYGDIYKMGRQIGGQSVRREMWFYKV